MALGRGLRKIGATVCILGTGIVGQACAAELAEAEVDVLMIEAGGEELSRRNRDLSAPGRPPVGHRFPDPSGQRLIQLGGTANCWDIRTPRGSGVRHVRLAPVDFEARPGVADTGWPITAKDLEPDYQAASEFCAIGVEEAAIDGSAAPEHGLQSRYFEVGPAARFGRQSPVLRRPGVSVLADSWCTGLDVSADGSRVVAAELRSARHGEVRCEADVFIVALGGLGNSLLLQRSMSAAHPSGIGNHADHLGRWFMDHPTAQLGSVTLDAVAFGLYDLHPVGDRYLWAKMMLDDDTVLANGLVGASTALIGASGPVRRRRRMRPLGPRTMVPLVASGLVGDVRGHTHSESFARRFATMAKAPDDLFWQYVSRGGRALVKEFDEPGWSTRSGDPITTLELVQSCEQLPDADNRIVLTDSLDALGQRRFAVHWRWTEDNDERLGRTQDRLLAAVESLGIGRLKPLNRTGTKRLTKASSHHHSGTTRMSTEPADGVVDPEGKVHGVDNLYVAGSSVFPTCGYANPTLTAVAMGLRSAKAVIGMT